VAYIRRKYTTVASKNVHDFMERFNASDLVKNLPGYSLAVVKLHDDGTCTMTNYSHGYANVEGKVPVSDATTFRIGSVSKTMTALCTSIM
jgi:CubicO group peptidase (beta-lactamase class C family)